jgi:hypothetical protein
LNVFDQGAVVDDDAAFEFEFQSPGEGGSKTSAGAKDDPEAAAPRGCYRIADRRGQFSIRVQNRSIDIEREDSVAHRTGSVPCRGAREKPCLAIRTICGRGFLDCDNLPGGMETTFLAGRPSSEPELRAAR